LYSMEIFCQKMKKRKEKYKPWDLFRDNEKMAATIRLVV
jgi:hypothetical protein